MKSLRDEIQELMGEIVETNDEIDTFEDLIMDMNDYIKDNQFVICFWNDGEYKGIDVFQDMDTVIEIVSEDIESTYHWVIQDWIGRKYKYAWSELILMLKKSMYDFFEENDGMKYHVHTYKRYADRIEIE